MKNTENPMTPPTPAAVRAALKNLGDDTTNEESAAWALDPRWKVYEILRDHIRAIAAEMRLLADSTYETGANTYSSLTISHAFELRRFADKMEGKQ